MFYSHEILTSRKYGFATVWLVATMGAGTKKVTRKAILEVDVTKTCDTIVAPGVPLALRLQSSLLYGVTRVYAQQCGYVLHDVEATRSRMLSSLKTVRSSDLNLEGTNRGRADHLVLGDDPSFFPDFDLSLAELDLTVENEQFSNLAITDSFISSISRRLSNDSNSLRLENDLMLDSMHSPIVNSRPLDGMDKRDDSMERTSKPRTVFSPHPQYQGLQDDLGLILEDDGNFGLQAYATSQERDIVAQVPSTGNAVIQHDDVGMLDDGLGDMMQIDEEDVREVRDATSNQHTPPAAKSVTSEVAHAPLRPRKAAKKAVPLDSNTELSRRVLRDQQDNYVANMLHDTVHKQLIASHAFARQNAAIWIYGGKELTDNPLSAFAGTQLLATVAKIDFGQTSRGIQDMPRSPEATRRLQPEGQALYDWPRDYPDAVEIQDYDEIERGREQPTPLDDKLHSTLLPWNQSTGSRPTGSNVTRAVSVGGRPRFSSMLPRNSRLATVSPLAAQTRYASLDVSDAPGVDWPAIDGMQLDDDVARATGITTQVIESQWLRSALGDESINFMAFVEDAIKQRDQLQENEVADMAGLSIDFDELLPITSHSYIVAAQAFLHILVLGTKKLLSAEQLIPFERITITMT